MPQVLTLDGVEAELYPERAEFARRRGSRNRRRLGFRRRKGLRMNKANVAKVAGAVGAAAALGGGAALIARSRRGKNSTPVMDAKKLLGAAGSTGQRGGALTKTNIRGYDAGNGSLAGRRKLSLGDRAAGVGRKARNKGRAAVKAVNRKVDTAVKRRVQRRASKRY